MGGGSKTVKDLNAKTGEVRGGKKPKSKKQNKKRQNALR